MSDSSSFLCGVLFSNDGSPPHDRTGCILPDNHFGPHEFVSDTGTRYHWETDWECDCEHCLGSAGDYCSVYWQVPHPAERG
mgnify:CR=1 FL=1